MKAQKIKILFLDQSIRDGGGGRSLFYLLKFIDQKRFEPVVMLPAEEGVLPERIRRENVCPILAEPLWHSSNGLLRFKFGPIKLNRLFSKVRNYLELLYLSLIKLPRWIRDNEVRVLHANNDTARVVALVAGALSGARVVWHMRNVKRAVWYAWLSRFFAVTRLIFISRAQQDLFPAPEKKSVVVYNGIDTEEFDPARVTPSLRASYRIPKEAVVFGVTGRLIPKKGYDHFLRAAQIVRQSTDRPLRFVIVGGALKEGQKKYLTYLETLAKELGLGEATIFTGFQKDIKPVLADLDVLVVPSVWEEPFGRTAIEAMAMRIPVVAYDVGGLREVLGDTSPMLCRGEDVVELADRMQKTLDAGLRKKLSEEGFRRVRENFTVEGITRQFEAVIERLA